VPQIPTTNLTKVIDEAERTIRDGAYVTVGLGVLALQRAQVRRRQLVKLVEQDLAGDRLDLDALATRWREATAQLSAGRAQLVERLNEQWDEAIASLSTNSESARAQIRQLLETVDGLLAPARDQLGQRLSDVATRLPAPAHDVVETVRAAAAHGEQRVREVVHLEQPRTTGRARTATRPTSTVTRTTKRGSRGPSGTRRSAS
jgi:hypothetical protein